MRWLLIGLLGVVLGATDPLTGVEQVPLMLRPNAQATGAQDHWGRPMLDDEEAGAAPHLLRAQATAGVAITLQTPSFRVGEVIAATVTNDSPQVIWTDDLKTDCTIAVLERQDGTVWQPQLYCNLERLSAAVSLPPHASLSVTIDPRSTHFVVPPGAPPAVGPGRYRLSVPYRLTPGPEGEAPYRAVSTVFTIGAGADTVTPTTLAGTGLSVATPIVPEVSPWWQFAGGGALLTWWTRWTQRRR